MNVLKSIWKSFVSWSDSLARARAAAELTRRGRYKDARDLIQRTHG